VISFFGLGYVGLVTALAFSSRGFRVYGYDVDESKIDSLRKGKLYIYEPGLQDLLKRSEGNFIPTSDHREAVLNTDITFIAVGTPPRQDGSADLSYIESAARMIGRDLREKKYHLVVVRSTVPPGTTERVSKIIEKESGKSAGRDFGICMSPEFLREGNAVEDIFNPDRVVIGSIDERSGDLLEELWRRFYGERVTILRTNLVNAEFIKYASNAFLAMKVSFINEIANIAQRVRGADVEVIAKGIGLDKRIGPLFLRAGLGFGGSCFPKDLRALIRFSEELGYNPKLLNSVKEVNDEQAGKAVELAMKLTGELKGKKVAVLGLSFKPNTDDMRDAVSIRVVEELLKLDAKVAVYDPAAVENARRIFGNRVLYASSPIDCIRNADCAIIVTEWDEFKKLGPEDFVNNMRDPVVIDGRRIYDPEVFCRRVKFAAIGLGEQE